MTNKQQDARTYVAQETTSDSELARLLQKPHAPSAMDLLLQQDTFRQLQAIAEVMARGVATTPEHLRGKQSDCLAIAMQAALWRMDPFAIARKSFLTPNGQLGYDGQLVNAVIIALAPIQSRPRFEHIGYWARIRGKFVERQNEATKKKYTAPAWKPEDEEGLGVIVSCTMLGETEPRTVEVMLKQCQPRFSTLWATDPEQQITYAAIRKWARRYAPDVLLGVYTDDEFEPASLSEDAPSFSVAPRPPARTEAAPPAERPAYDDASFAGNLAEYRKLIASGKRTAQQIEQAIARKGFALTDDQRAKLAQSDAAPPSPAPAVGATSDPWAPTPEEAAAIRAREEEEARKGE